MNNSAYQHFIALLIDMNKATSEQLSEQWSLAQQKQNNFPKLLLEENIVDADELLWLWQRVSNFSVVDLDSVNISAPWLEAFDQSIITAHMTLPLYDENDCLFVATHDPLAKSAFDVLKKPRGYHSVQPLLVNFNQLSTVIESLIGRTHHGAKPALDSTPTEMAERQSVIDYVEHLLDDAIQNNASDVHFEPYENSYRIRFRKDGVLRIIETLSVDRATRVTARLKVMANLDIAEKRVPQDGRIHFVTQQTETVDMRVNTLPTLWGEKVVVRILDNDIEKLQIDVLGMTAKQQSHYVQALKKAQGLILVTGPTGSGKTTSLYAGLNLLNQSTVNILTVEDPVEINLPGINQVSVMPKQGMTFASASKAFLRQDPDIMMVGEMRDVETAEIAISAAQTGHLVLSTLHTNDVPQTLARLGNMGVAPYHIADSVVLIMAQRLVRYLCPQCKIVDSRWSTTQLIALGFSDQQVTRAQLSQPVGCEACDYQGYQGRTAIHQVVPISPALSALILQSSDAESFAQQCQLEAHANLRQAGIEKVLQGTTSLDEVLRVTG